MRIYVRELMGSVPVRLQDNKVNQLCLRNKVSATKHLPKFRFVATGHLLCVQEVVTDFM